MQIAYNGLQSDENSYVKEFAYLRPWGVDLGVVNAAVKAIAGGRSSDILDLVKGKKSAITKETIINAAKKRR